MFLLLSLKLLLSSAGYLTPEQIHLSWTDSPNEIKITWITFLPVPSLIYYRRILCQSSSKWMKAESFYHIFDAGKYFYRLEYIHSGIIEVDKDCTYEYYVGSFFGWSAVHTFSGKTHGPSVPGPVSLLVVADWGGGSEGVFTKNLIVHEIKNGEVNAILHAGDIAYELGDLEGMVGDIWFNMIEPIAARVPYMTLPGNHETEANYSQYRNKYKMPVNEANEASGFFYSFDLGAAHFIMFNTEVFFDEYAVNEVFTEMNWLKQDLEKANRHRSERPWIVMLTHRLLYCATDWNSKEGPKGKDCGVHSVRLRGALEEILHREGVDLFIQAHVHNYERNTPIYNNLTVKSDYDDLHIHVNPKATVYITNGNAGSKYGHNDPISTTMPLWSVYASEEFGYGRVVVHNTTHFYYEQFSAQSLKVIDYVWIIKESS